MTAALTWHCLIPGCGEHGTTTGTESDADTKHASSGHATVSHVAVWVRGER